MIQDTDLDALVTFLRDIVRIPSFSGQEGEVVSRIAEEMRQVGFEHVWIDAVGNVIGQIGSGGEKLLMESHIDTVGLGDAASWADGPQRCAGRHCQCRQL